MTEQPFTPTSVRAQRDEPEYADPFWQCETAKQAVYRYAVQGSKPGGDVVFGDLRGHAFTLTVSEDGLRVDAAPAVTKDAMAAALRLILAQTHGDCEHSTTGIGSCFENSRTADAVYGCDMACASCIAHAALNNRPIPRGPGAEAVREQERGQ
jgi:hypothetical protein